jgi:hypothetical protein
MAALDINGQIDRELASGLAFHAEFGWKRPLPRGDHDSERSNRVIPLWIPAPPDQNLC